MLRSWCVSYQTTPWDYRIIRSRRRWVLQAEHYELEEFGSLRHSGRPRDFFGRVLRLCSPSTWSFWLASRASFGAHRVSFRPFQRIEICSGMPHWGIFLSHHFLVVRRSEPSSSLPRLTFGVTFPVSAFRAIISSLLAFRAITFPFRRSKPSSYLRSVFRAIKIGRASCRERV